MRVVKVAGNLKHLRQSGLVFGSVIDVDIQHLTPVLVKIFPKLHHYLFEPVAGDRRNHVNERYGPLCEPFGYSRFLPDHG